MHPRALGLLLLLGITASLLSRSLLLLLSAWFAACMLMYTSKLISIHLKFALYGITPVFLALILVWSTAQISPPVVPIDWPASAGMGYALLVSIRIATAGAIMQSMILPELRRGRIPTILASWGIPASGIQIATSSLVLQEDFQRRVRQVIEARTARGLMPNSRWGKLRSLPLLLRPVFISSLESAISRSELWQQRGLDPLDLKHGEERQINWRNGDSAVVLIALAYLAAAVFTIHVNN